MMNGRAPLFPCPITNYNTEATEHRGPLAPTKGGSGRSPCETTVCVGMRGLAAHLKLHEKQEPTEGLKRKKKYNLDKPEEFYDLGIDTKLRSFRMSKCEKEAKADRDELDITYRRKLREAKRAPNHKLAKEYETKLAQMDSERRAILRKMVASRVGCVAYCVAEYRRAIKQPAGTDLDDSAYNSQLGSSVFRREWRRAIGSKRLDFTYMHTVASRCVTSKGFFTFTFENGLLFHPPQRVPYGPHEGKEPIYFPHWAGWRDYLIRSRRDGRGEEDFENDTLKRVSNFTLAEVRVTKDRLYIDEARSRISGKQTIANLFQPFWRAHKERAESAKRATTSKEMSVSKKTKKDKDQIKAKKKSPAKQSSASSSLVFGQESEIAGSFDPDPYSMICVERKVEASAGGSSDVKDLQIRVTTQGNDVPGTSSASLQGVAQAIALENAPIGSQVTLHEDQDCEVIVPRKDRRVVVAKTDQKKKSGTPSTPAAEKPATKGPSLLPKLQLDLLPTQENYVNVQAAEWATWAASSDSELPDIIEVPTYQAVPYEENVLSTTAKRILSGAYNMGSKDDKIPPLDKTVWEGHEHVLNLYLDEEAWAELEKANKGAELDPAGYPKEAILHDAVVGKPDRLQFKNICHQDMYGSYTRMLQQWALGTSHQLCKAFLVVILQADKDLKNARGQLRLADKTVKVLAQRMEQKYAEVAAHLHHVEVQKGTVKLMTSTILRLRKEKKEAEEEAAQQKQRREATWEQLTTNQQEFNAYRKQQQDLQKQDLFPNPPAKVTPPSAATSSSTGAQAGSTRNTVSLSDYKTRSTKSKAFNLTDAKGKTKTPEEQIKLLENKVALLETQLLDVHNDLKNVRAENDVLVAENIRVGRESATYKQQDLKLKSTKVKADCYRIVEVESKGDFLACNLNAPKHIDINLNEDVKEREKFFEDLETLSIHMEQSMKQWRDDYYSTQDSRCKPFTAPLLPDLRKWKSRLESILARVYCTRGYTVTRLCRRETGVVEADEVLFQTLYEKAPTVRTFKLSWGPVTNKAGFIPTGSDQEKTTPTQGTRQPPSMRADAALQTDSATGFGASPLSMSPTRPLPTFSQSQLPPPSPNRDEEARKDIRRAQDRAAKPARSTPNLSREEVLLTSIFEEMKMARQIYSTAVNEVKNQCADQAMAMSEATREKRVLTETIDNMGKQLKALEVEKAERSASQGSSSSSVLDQSFQSSNFGGPPSMQPPYYNPQNPVDQRECWNRLQPPFNQPPQPPGLPYYPAQYPYPPQHPQPPLPGSGPNQGYSEYPVNPGNQNNNNMPPGPYYPQPGTSTPDPGPPPQLSQSGDWTSPNTSVTGGPVLAGGGNTFPPHHHHHSLTSPAGSSISGSSTSTTGSTNTQYEDATERMIGAVLPNVASFVTPLDSLEKQPDTSSSTSTTPVMQDSAGEESAMEDAS